MFKKNSKKAASRKNTSGKLVNGAKRVGREIAYVGLGVTTGVVTARATAIAGGMLADAGQAVYDVATGGATATVKERGLFKKTKEVRLDDMKALKKYKSVQYHGLHDEATRTKVAKGMTYAGGGIGLVTGATAYTTLRGVEAGIKAVNQMGQVYYDMPDEELYEDVPEGEEA